MSVKNSLRLVLKQQLNDLLQSDDFINSSDNVKKIVEIEAELSKLDSNLEIVKAYFSSKLELSTLDNSLIVSFKNRILSTNSIENAIRLYEMALEK